MKSLAIGICLLLCGSLAFAQTRQDSTSSQFEEEYESDTSSIYQDQNYEQSDIGVEEEMEETESEMEEMEQEAETEYNEAEQEVEEHEKDMHQMETETESDVDQMEQEAEEMDEESEMDRSQTADMQESDQASVQVESDEKLDADFGKYKTYNFVSHVDEELDPGFYFLNDLELKGNVRETVEGELEGLGYERDQNDPDLLVSFRVFDEPLTLRGFTDPAYGPGYWGPNIQVREWEDTTSYDVEAGTLLLSVLDAEEGEIVWQGFASGLINQDAFTRDEQKIAEAVELLFEEYGHRGDDLDSQTVK